MKAILSRIFLQNFRSYKNLDLNFTKPFVVLHGPNGAGKTNILEAISLFTPGKGMRKADLKEMQNDESDQPWAVSLKIDDNVIGTGITALDARKRIWMLNNEHMRSQKTLNELLRLFWLTPETDRLFLDSPSKRRQFIDRMIFVLHPEYANVVKAYEYAVKERLNLLTNHYSDHNWIKQLELTIADNGLKIIETRSNFLKELPLDIEITAGMEGASENTKTRDEYLAELEKYRPRDGASGMTLFGPHRSDMGVTYIPKNQKAANCSTGEQKMILAKLIIAFLKHLQQHLTVPLLLLFDDVISHLDFSNRVLLFEQLLTLNNFKDNNTMIQVFFTSTENAAFESIKSYADFFEINKINQGQHND